MSEDDAGDATEPEFRSVGVEIICHPDVADDVVQQLRDAVADILDGYTDDEIADYGIG